VKLSSEYAKSQLNLGYLVHPRQNGEGTPRGEGFELRTDHWGAVRAGKGLFLSAEARAAASSTHLDVREAKGQLEASLKLAEDLSDSAGKHNADKLEANEEAKDFIKIAGATAQQGQSKVPAFSEPILLASAPAGIGLTTPKSTHLETGEHLHLIAGKDANVGIGKKLALSIGEALSIFVYQAGMKLFAAKGKIQVQAQSDRIEIIADKGIDLVSVNDNVNIAAPKQVLLTSGGAYIRMAGGNIDIHAPGMVDIKGATHSFGGPAGTSYPMPRLPRGDWEYKPKGTYPFSV
jgi:type VI secretion system secreted protein VgrG